MQNLEVIKIDSENSLIYLKGSFPGSKNSTVFVKKAIKNISKLTISEKFDKLQKQKNIDDKKKKK